MRAIDSGHLYELKTLDVDGSPGYLQFVKRIGEKYPGNEAPAYGGTIIQEVCRALIDRLRYVDNQQPAYENAVAISLLRSTIWMLEKRAARVGGYEIKATSDATIEHIETCEEHLHIQCGKCKK